MYVDEAGDLAGLAKPPRPNDQPVFILTGLILHWDRIRPFTAEFLSLKRRFFPNLRHPELKLHLDWILPEVKGVDVRRSALSGSRNRRRQSQVFISGLLDLLERHEARLVGRVWVKQPGVCISPRSMYAYSVQDLFTSFEDFLSGAGAKGICIADSRTKQLNEPIAHSVFTQLHSVGPSFHHIKEVPLFGHSGNHAGLQASDLIASGLLMPIACHAYCRDFVQNVHVNLKAAGLRDQFGARLGALQYRYVRQGRLRGGIVTHDPVNRASAAELFKVQEWSG